MKLSTNGGKIGYRHEARGNGNVRQVLVNRFNALFPSWDSDAQEIDSLIAIGKEQRKEKKSAAKSESTVGFTTKSAIKSFLIYSDEDDEDENIADSTTITPPRLPSRQPRKDAFTNVRRIVPYLLIGAREISRSPMKTASVSMMTTCSKSRAPKVYRLTHSKRQGSGHRSYNLRTPLFVISHSLYSVQSKTHHLQSTATRRFLKLEKIGILSSQPFRISSKNAWILSQLQQV